MASRPAKRQRRSTIVLSDDDEELELPSPKPSFNARVQREITLDGRTSLDVSPVNTGKGKTSSRRAAPKPSPKSSPAKTKKTTKAQKEPEKSKSLHTFFTKATEEQRWRKRSETPDIVADLENGEIGDAIEDDDLSDGTLQELSSRTDKAATSLQDSRKPALPALANRKNGLGIGPLSSSQRFVKGPPPKDTVRIKVEDQDQSQAVAEGYRPWADRYGPANLEELVVHKKKVADVQGWLQGKCTGRHSQVSILISFNRCLSVC